MCSIPFIDQLNLFIHRKWAAYCNDTTLSHLDIPLNSDRLWAHCKGVSPLLMTSDVLNIAYSRARGRNRGHVLTWQPNEGQVAAASKLTSMKALGETAACSPALISPQTDLDTSYRRAKQSFHCCGEGWTFIFPLRVSGQRCAMGSLRGCGLTPYGRGTRLIRSMLLWYRLAELPLCPPAYRLNEAIYRAVHYGLKCTTTLRWPIKDKGCHIIREAGQI